jgi:hypothetical protein
MAKKPTRTPRADDITGTEGDNAWTQDFYPGAKIESVLPPASQEDFSELDRMLAEAGEGEGRSDEDILREILAQPDGATKKPGKSETPSGVGAIDHKKLRSLGDTIQNLLGGESEPAKPESRKAEAKAPEKKAPITQYDSNAGFPEDDTFKNDFQRTIADMYGSPGDMAEQMQKSATMAASVLPSAGVAGVGLRRMLGKGGSAALEDAAPAAQGLIASKLGRKGPPPIREAEIASARARVPPIREAEIASARARVPPITDKMKADSARARVPAITEQMRADTLRSRVPAIREDMKYRPKKMSVEEIQAADRAARQKGLKIDPKKIDREASDYRARGSRAPEPVKKKSVRSKLRGR